MVVILVTTSQFGPTFFRSLNFVPHVLSLLSNAYKFARDATLFREREMVTRLGTNVTYPGIFAT
jgi:hypothetical protein